MDPLKDQLNGVTPPSPVEPEVEPEVTPVVTDEGGDRTIDNVRGELVRKLEDSEKRSDAKLDAILSRMETMQTDIAGRTQEPASQPASTPGGNPLDTYSVDQLQAALVNEQVDDATKQSIQAYIPVRVAREEARRIGEENRKVDVAARTRTEANQAAVDRYPDLVDPATKLHKEVNRILLARGSQTQNPTAVLDAANEAAARLGVGIKAPNRQPRVPGKPGGLGNQAPVANQSSEDYEGMTDAEIDAIAPKLAHLLGRNKDGTQKAFDRDFIKERSKLYKDRY